MMWRCMDLVHLLFPLVSIATFWSVVYGQSDTNGPCNTCPIECIGRQCAQYWWTSMWGFIVTLVALTMDVWGVSKFTNESTIHNVLVAFFASTFNPFILPWKMLDDTMNGLATLSNLHEAFGNDVIAPWYCWSKSHIKIISGCDVIVNLSPDVHKENKNLNAFLIEATVEDFLEAPVIEHKVANSKQYNVELSPHGKLALLRSKVLPPYDELKVLCGNSSLGMEIASAQAIGYIYGLIVRCMQGLRVSPIEAIACVLNMVILMKGVLHNFASVGHRPLLLYLLPQEEAKFIEECKNIEGFEFKTIGRFNLGVSIICGVLLAMGAYFIVNFLKSLSQICTIPIILFEVSLVLGGILGVSLNMDCSVTFIGYLTSLVVLLNFVGYVWALVVTFNYWKGEEFDVRSSNHLSQVLPYIG